MSVPAARVRTSSGWRDIAIQGPQGIPGLTPSGRAKSAAYAITADTNARFLNPALTVDFDSIGGNCFTANQGRFTAPVAGRYLVGFTITELGNGTASIGVILNATTVLKRITAAGGTGADGTKAGIECWGIYNLNAGDNLMIHGWSSGGGSTNIIAIDAIRLDAPAVSVPSNRPQYVTPAQFAALTPVDGLEVYLIADATNGVIWHLRYNASSSSAYKWEFVGGGTLSTSVMPYENCTSGSYSDLTTAGPGITVPLAGDYVYSLSADIRPPSGLFGAVGPKWGAAAVADDDAAWLANPGAGHAGVTDSRVNGLAASTLCKLQYKINGSGTMLCGRRHFAMRPVRVG